MSYSSMQRGSERLAEPRSFSVRHYENRLRVRQERYCNYSISFGEELECVFLRTRPPADNDRFNDGAEQGYRQCVRESSAQENANLIMIPVLLICESSMQLSVSPQPPGTVAGAAASHLSSPPGIDPAADAVSPPPPPGTVAGAAAARLSSPPGIAPAADAISPPPPPGTVAGAAAAHLSSPQGIAPAADAVSSPPPPGTVPGAAAAHLSSPPGLVSAADAVTLPPIGHRSKLY